MSEAPGSCWIVAVGKLNWINPSATYPFPSSAGALRFARRTATALPVRCTVLTPIGDHFMTFSPYRTPAQREAARGRGPA